ncbi:MAG: DUF3293 domain-containing protein [Methylotenera sp.]|nr:DUF3293 domain-containing protein [Methylotenera sp.]MDP2404589.1 DUF3293 domain-containing protein [Methylotenera sp.]MDP3094367.1 DUF3293 domain-containing protein [Methylotenera sp.]MDZ4222201.1 DUF3293 domain-containing protein [Methylotenera sp.]
MFSTTASEHPLIQSYLETHYHVGGASPFVLQIDIVCDSLKELYRQSNADCCAYVTACNPFSHPVDDATNADRQAALVRELKARSLSFIEGVGQHPSGNWPGEPSYLVLGLSLEVAKALGRKYEQNAIVWCGPDAVPKLWTGCFGVWSQQSLG